MIYFIDFLIISNIDALYHFFVYSCEFYRNFTGFFLSINLSTVLGQTGDWGIFSSGLLVGALELISKILYKIKKISEQGFFLNKKPLFNFIEILNGIKIGFLYGFFVEAFKLGS
uniref:hypothetical protein ycf20 n=1 Tax=Cryptomonas gyropyrenoidosa TaxID=233257 RepID=UPI00279B8BB4|nr:hypothetical protein ycf20 [Cryptomonas gyropyrenoidosa]WFQ82921.1 hypothetical protein ycf20 [Cryptomonas gyropyrenoidosa]